MKRRRKEKEEKEKEEENDDSNNKKSALAEVVSKDVSMMGESIEQVKTKEVLTKDGISATRLHEETIFKNANPGGNELLRLFAKTTEKDSQDRMVAEMQQLDQLSKEVPAQVFHT